MQSDVHAIAKQQKHILTQLQQDFFAKRPVNELLQAYSRQIDQLVQEHSPRTAGFAILAIAGYGRSELFPLSDIDVLVIHPNQSEPGNALLDFCQLLLDAGIPLSHSIRSISNAVAFAGEDLNFYTSLLEMRFVSGENLLFSQLQTRLRAAALWPGETFLSSKLAEQTQRHRKYRHNLEPNLKESPGALRDIQLLNWAMLHITPSANSPLPALPLFTPAEQTELLAALQQLQTARFALHTLSGKADERLSFEHQKSLINCLYPEDHSQAALAKTMQQLQQAMQTVQFMQELGLQSIKERYYATSNARIKINAYFHSEDGYLGIRTANVYQQYPATLLQGFIVLCQHPELAGFNANTLRALRQHLGLIDAKFRRKPEHQALFLALFDQDNGVSIQVKRMHSYRVLSAYLAEFSHLVGQMQFDLFHHYTVDIHTLAVIQQLHDLVQGKLKDALPLTQLALAGVPHVRTLYLAGLFHDIGKGLGGDHSTLGAETMLRFCQNHALDPEETTLLSWLIQHHLLMSLTAQKTDIADPEVVERFARRVGSKLYLDHLYLLTIADIRGTNMKLWNDWKATLLGNLYQATVKVLETSEPADLNERIMTKQAQVYRCFAPQAAKALQAQWQEWSKDYFLHFNANELLWQAEALQSAPPVIALRNHPEHKQCELFLYLKHRPHLFSLVTSTIDRLGLNIVQARFYTLPAPWALHHYVVLEQSGATLNDQARLNEIRQQLALRLANTALPKVAKRRSIQAQPFVIPTQIRCHELSRLPQTQIEIISQDRPGLLARVALVLDQFALQIHSAKIATFGQRVEDSFYLSTATGASLGPALQKDLTEALLQAVDK